MYVCMYVCMYVYVCISISLYIYIYIYIYTYPEHSVMFVAGRSAETMRQALHWSTRRVKNQATFTSLRHSVSFHNFKSQNFKLSVSNPKSKYVAYLSVLSQFSNCQGLGRKNKHEILKTDRGDALAWCSGGRRPLIAGCLSLQRLGMDLPGTCPALDSKPRPLASDIRHLSH